MRGAFNIIYAPKAVSYQDTLGDELRDHLEGMINPIVDLVRYDLNDRKNMVTK